MGYRSRVLDTIAEAQTELAEAREQMLVNVEVDSVRPDPEARAKFAARIEKNPKPDLWWCWCHLLRAQALINLTMSELLDSTDEPTKVNQDG